MSLGGSRAARRIIGEWRGIRGEGELREVWLNRGIPFHGAGLQRILFVALDRTWRHEAIGLHGVPRVKGIDIGIHVRWKTGTSMLVWDNKTTFRLLCQKFRNCIEFCCIG